MKRSYFDVIYGHSVSILVYLSFISMLFAFVIILRLLIDVDYVVLQQVYCEDQDPNRYRHQPKPRRNLPQAGEFWQEDYIETKWGKVPLSELRRRTKPQSLQIGVPEVLLFRRLF